MSQPEGGQAEVSGRISGPPVVLQVRLQAGWPMAAWAALCGLVASATLGAAGTGSGWGERGIRVLLLLFLVEVGWRGVWTLLAATDWATLLERWRGWRQSVPLPPLPYTQPDAPAGRLWVRLGQLLHWGSTLLWPQQGTALATLLALLLLTPLLGAVLGGRVLLLTGAALALSEMAAALVDWNGRGASGFQAVIEVGLAWLAGHLLLAPEVPGSGLLLSTGLALAFALAHEGGLRLARRDEGLGAWLGGQGLALLLLVLGHRPWAAGALGLLLVPQLLRRPWLETEGGARYVARARPWLLLAMAGAVLI